MPCSRCEHCKELKKLPIAERKDKRNPDVQAVWDYATIELGLSTFAQKGQRYAIARLLKKMSVEQIKKALEVAVEVKSMKFAPQVNNIYDLEEKLPNLRDFFQRNREALPPVIKL